MALPRMCKIKEVSKHTNGLISGYAARLLFLQGKIPGVRIGGDNSPILIDLDGLEKWIAEQARANIKDTEKPIQEYGGKLRKIL